MKHFLTPKFLSPEVFQDVGVTVGSSFTDVGPHLKTEQQLPNEPN